MLGVEDDGIPTGCPHTDDAELEALLEVPTKRLRPPLNPGRVVELDGHRLLIFEVSAAARAVMVEGKRLSPPRRR